ncbi:MAG: nucleotidyltransferase family protein [Bacteroidales bacterium]|nr:nucleotidyltransferase family protein [Bacteroidales bacterium]
MHTQNQYITALQHFKQEYGAKYGITRMGIFGSVARGEHTEESDVDVLVEAPEMSVYTLIGIRHELEEMMKVPVDVVFNSKYMPKKFKTRIEREIVYV